MTIRTRPIRRLAVLAAALAVAPVAVQAQSLKDLTGAMGAVTGDGGLPSVDQASPSNLTGSGKAGSGGMLETGDGDTFSLSGSDIREKVTEQVCDLVLEHVQSLLRAGEPLRGRSTEIGFNKI